MYYCKMSDDQKKAYAAKVRAWEKANPEKSREYRRRAYLKRKEKLMELQKKTEEK